MDNTKKENMIKDISKIAANWWADNAYMIKDGEPIISYIFKPKEPIDINIREKLVIELVSAIEKEMKRYDNSEIFMHCSPRAIAHILNSTIKKLGMTDIRFPAEAIMDIGLDHIAVSKYRNPLEYIYITREYCMKKIKEYSNDSIKLMYQKYLEKLDE